MFSYFKGKNANESLTKAYKFLIEKNSLRNELKFQLTNITGNIPKTKDNKIHNFSITHLGRKRKLPLKEPIETIVVCPQQNFEIAGGLNSIQIELEDGRILNALKRYKNAMYKVTPLGLLFPTSIKNDMKQVFITCIELNGVQKSIFNEKVYDHLAIIDVDKINSWQEIKGQSIWINDTFKDQKEINNNSHMCFPFVTKSLNNLLSFSIHLQENKNKEIEFNSGEKKISILNFQIDVFLRWAEELDKIKHHNKLKKNKSIFY